MTWHGNLELKIDVDFLKSFVLKKS